MKWYFSREDCLHIGEVEKVPDFIVNKTAEPPWQMWKNRIRTVVFEEGITDIGIGIFRDWIHLERVVLPKSLKRIHSDCFSGCINLKEVIPASDDTDFLYLYDYMDELRRDPLFDKKDGREVIVFENNAFYDVPWALKKWGTWYISHGTLYTCLHRQRQMVIPDTVESIGPYAFYGPEVELVILPGILDLKIHEDAFSGSCIHYTKQMKKRLPDAFMLEAEDGGDAYPDMKRFRVREKKPGWHYRPRDPFGNVQKEYRGIVGTDTVNGAYYLAREVKKGKVAVGILFHSGKKLVKEVHSLRWSDWNQDYRQYYETPYYEDGDCSVRMRGRYAMIFGKDYEELEYEFYSAQVMGTLTEGYDIVRYSDPESHEEWFLVDEEEFAYGEVETLVLNIWMKNHPDYRLPEEG